jgi:hypothetical protein
MAAGFVLLDHHSGIFNAPACLGTFSVLLSISSKSAAASLRLFVAMGAPGIGNSGDADKRSRMTR